METFIFLFCFLLFSPNLNGFLLDKTTSTNLGISGHQYVALMELLTEEIKARKNIEDAVTQIHTELVSKTLNITDLRDQTHTIAELKNSLKNMENKTEKLEQSVQELKMENTALHQSYAGLQMKYSIMQRNYSNVQQQNTVLLQNYSSLQVAHDEFKNKLTAQDKKSAEIEMEMSALKQLKAINQLQDINTLQMNTQTLNHQVLTLTTNQAARGQDFLALYNQTLAFRSDMARDLTKLSMHHNDSIDMLFRNLQNENKTAQQLMNQMNKTMHVFNQEIADNVTQSNSQIKKMLHDEILVIRRQVEDENNARGTTYVRWSRKQCPNINNTELVYSGYTGGGSTGDAGAATKPVCLPLDPDFNKTSGGDYGRMRGAEFLNNFFSSGSFYQDVPCAVCRVKKASSVIMIPGKNRCHIGWNMEYHGYLASSHYNNPGAISYTCIDIQPEFVDGGSSHNGNGIQFYEVVANCGSLHCPPYHNNYPLTCVVCSK